MLLPGNFLILYLVISGNVGLDAASALSICKVIRAALEAQSFSAITCLLQPSDDVFNTFQRLILLTPDGQVCMLFLH